MTLTDWSEVASTAESFATIAALGIGAFASYVLFWHRRQIFPRADLSLGIEQHRIARSKVLIRVAANLRNSGDVLIALEEGYAILCQIAPCDKSFNDQSDHRVNANEATPHEIQPPRIAKLHFRPGSPCEIEPGETESIFFDFVVERGKHRLLKTHVHFTNAVKKKKTVGWNAQAIIEVMSCDTGGKSKGDANAR